MKQNILKLIASLHYTTAAELCRAGTFMQPAASNACAHRELGKHQSRHICAPLSELFTP
jgi:hypothetical protein